MHIGGVSWAGSGVGRIVQYNGSSGYLAAESSSILAGRRDWSIQAYVRLTAGGTTSGRAIYCERAATGNDILKLDSTDANHLNAFGLTLRNDGGTLLQIWGPASADVWTLITAVKRGTTVQLYYGSRLAASGTWSGNDTFTDSGLETRIGGDAGDSVSRFLGGISHVLPFAQALTSAQVALVSAFPFAYHIRYSSDALLALAQSAVPLLLSGLIEGVGSASGSLQVSRLLGGAGSGAGQVTGSAEIQRLLAGSLAGCGGVDAALEISRQLAGSVAGNGSVSGEAEIRRLFSGTSAGAGSVEGELEIARQLAGIVAGAGTAAGELLVSRLLAGAVFGTGSLSGELLIIRALVCYGGSVEIATLFGGLLAIALDFGGAANPAVRYGGSAAVALELTGTATPAVVYGGSMEACCCE